MLALLVSYESLVTRVKYNNISKCLYIILDCFILSLGSKIKYCIVYTMNTLVIVDLTTINSGYLKDR